MAETKVKKKSFAEKVTKGIVYAMLAGTAFFLVGGIAAPYVPGVTAQVIGAVGATGAFAISVFPSNN